MRMLLLAAAIFAALALGVGAGRAGSDGTVRDLSLPRPAWLTADLEARILASGTHGVEVPIGNAADPINVNCLGYAPPYVSASGASVTAVSAGTCMVSPAGCTMSFVFTDGTSSYIGTAGHCGARGQRVIAQIATRVDPTDTVIATLAAIGTVDKSWNAGIGKDFALVKIASGFKVVPGMAGVLGPIGVFCGDPVAQPVMHYGHGYVFLVEQGNPKFGEVVPDLTQLFRFTTTHGYNWVGYGLAGDSGSGVMNDAGLAVGDLTHGLSVGGVPVPGLNFGTDMAEIFSLIGPGYKLVTVDGRQADCAHPLGI